MSDNHLPGAGDRRPVPDPTLLTTEQLRRELGMLRELIEARLEGMDKTHALLQAAVRDLETDEHVKRTALKELFIEKFNGINDKFSAIALQFTERDIRNTASERAAKEASAAQLAASSTAVSAAFSAQKESAFATQQSNAEAIRKSEAGFTNEINSLKALIESTKETLAVTLGDLRSRLDRGEGNNSGIRENKRDINMTTGSVVGIVSAVIALCSFIGLILLGVTAHQTQPTVVSSAVIPLQGQK